MRKSFLLLTLCVAGLFQAKANSSSRITFIDTYKELAISEMHRTGIPASIKLAQAILESNAGQSTLAREANNHFGIKCGSYWKGRTFYRKDDDRNKKGKLIKSCFRAFKFASQSWIEHSDFLAVQNRKRYDFLFNYSASDYTNWAYGLKKAGYATDPNYAPRLIQIIEDYKLYQYDNPTANNQDLAKVKNRTSTITHIHKTKAKTKKKKETNVFEEDQPTEISMTVFKEQLNIKKINGVSAYIIDSKMNLTEVADKTDISTRKLIKYNNDIRNTKKDLPVDFTVFLAPRKSKYKGKTKYHYVRANETMESIARKYGIKTEALNKLNRIPEGKEPIMGERLALKRPLPKNRSVTVKKKKTTTAINRNQKSKPITTSHTKLKAEDSSERLTEVLGSSNSSQDESKELTPDQNFRIHVVSKGETLWGLARQYSISIEELKMINKLSSSVLSIGQELKIRS